MSTENFSFIKNSEIRVLINEKDLGKYKKKESGDENNQSTVQFTKNELELLRKLDETDFEEDDEQEKSENDEIKKRPAEKKQAKDLKQKSLTLQELKDLKNQFGDDQFLCDILNEDAVIELPQNEMVERNPVLEERVKRLKAQQANREYNSMTKNVDARRKHHEPTDSIAYQVKQINRQLIAVAQFVFSVVSGFFFGFLGIALIVGDLDFGFRLLLGIICALIIALAEIYFLAKNLIEEEEYEEKQQEGSPVKDYPSPSSTEKVKTN